MLKSLSLALGQLGDPAILKVLAKSLLITLALCVLLGLGAGYGGQWYFDQQVDADLHDSYYTVLTGIARTLVVLLTIFFGFRLIAIPVIGFFADQVVAAVEARHFPAQAITARPVGFGLSLRLGLMSALRLVLFNLLALPLYIILLVTAVGPIVLFVLINAILLGRDLGEMVAVRHLDTVACRDWLRTSRGPRLVLGLVVTGIFLVPVANILAPIIGAAMATHLFHDARNRRLLGGRTT
jgi:CysZ protein